MNAVDVVMCPVRKRGGSDDCRITALGPAQGDLVEERMLVRAIPLVVAVVDDHEVDTSSPQELGVRLSGRPVQPADALWEELRVQVPALAHDLVHADLAVTGANDPVGLLRLELRRV